MAGTPPSGFGRGGRGAALLQAMQNPPRRPGDSSTSAPEAGSSRTLGGRGILSLGRGASLLQAVKTQSDRALAQGSTASAGPGLPIGRGALGRGFRMPGTGPVAQHQSQPQSRQVQPQPAISASTPAIGRGAGEPVITPSERASAQGSQASAGPGSSSQRPVSLPIGRGALGRGLSMPVTGPVAQQQPAQPRSQQMQPQPASTTGSAIGRGASEPQTHLENMIERMKLEEDLVEQRGSFGDRVPLSSNYICVKCHNDGVFQYGTSFTPNIDSLGMRKKIMYNLQHTIGNVFLFDGAILFLPIKLPNRETVATDVRPTDQQEITIRIKLVKAINPENCKHIYNILLRNIMRILKYTQVGRQYYDPHRPASIPQHKMEVWPGYVHTIDRYAGGLMLQVDVSHRVLRTDTVLDVMYDVQRLNHDQVAIERKIIGMSVLARYNNKTYRIDDIEWKMNPTHTFMKGNEEITFQDYYRQMYNKNIRDLGQPLLVHRPKIKADRTRKRVETIILIPELCYCTGLTDDIRKDFKVMKDLAQHTRITPGERVRALRAFSSNVMSCPEAMQELAKWGLEIDNDVIRTEGRLLPTETIFMDNKENRAYDRADFTRFVTSNPVLTAVNLEGWLIIATKRDKMRVNGFKDEYHRVVRHMGIQAYDPKVVLLEDDRTDSYLRALRDNVNRQIQIVVTIMPSSRDDRYNAVKKLCCVERTVPSQVINSKTISRPEKMRSIVTKIALQMNCKLGGELWAVKIPGKLLMCVGIDVYHDGKSRKGQSVGAFVASLNNRCTRWYSRVAFQQPGQELIDSLKVCFTAALRTFQEVNGTFPERIIVFRDGVGDGDFNYVAKYEAKQLSDCFLSFGEPCKPKFGVIVVQKRINTKIFALQNMGRQGQFQNPPPGTVVDHTITRRGWLDFFLVSQHVGQGTVNPTHYVVVHDHTEWDIDKLQRLTYKMTHLYYNWTGTIRVPAPCQYAHKLAYLVGQNIKKEPDPLLTDRLFFL